MTSMRSRSCGRRRLGEVLSLYPDELSYAEAAFAELGSEEGSDIRAPELHPHLDGFTLWVPEDLQRRFTYLPPELRRKHWELKLTTDRKRVQQALEQARQSDNEWPEWELLWNQHPVAEWLNDRVLSRFARHEAPLIRVNGMAPDDVIFVFQGVLSNLRSQPVIVEWFGVLHDGREMAVLDDYALIESTGLDQELSNPATTVESDQLEELLPEAVKRAEEHMVEQRQSRSVKLGPALRGEQRRVKRWYRAAADRIDSEIARKAEGRKLRSDEQRRFDEQRAHLERLMSSRAKWIKEGLETVATPYLRVAAALISKERD